MKVVVVGGIAAGPSLATRLRRLNEHAEIILFERGADISVASCALPYYLGGVITDRQSLIERTPEILKQKNNIDVRVHTEVTAIDAAAKTLTVQPQAGSAYQESYDKLVIATGASPILPPIPGLQDAQDAFTIRSMHDADRIFTFLEDRHPQSATLLGGGPAGVEIAENLRHRGLEVTLIDQAEHIMAPYDADMATLLENELTANGVDLRTNTQVTAVANNGHLLTLSDDTTHQTDLLIVVTGVAPNNQLAASAGLALAADGHIKVDAQLQTSVPDIYAIGDVIETASRITRKRVPSVLSSAANRQGHLLADILNGADLTYPGFIGVSVAQVFGLTASNVGYTTSMLDAAGITDYDAASITPFAHAFFYPNAQRLNVKLLYAKTTGKIYGGQFVGAEGADKRAGELAVAIAGGLTINDLPDLEFPYSPPYSSSRDVLNVAGYVALNRQAQLAGTVSLARLTPAQQAAACFLDIREPGRPESAGFRVDAHIPLSQLRDRLDELPQGRQVYVIARKGLGPYNATRILAGNGFEVKVVTA